MAKRNAFKAARSYRDEVVAKHPPLSMQEYSSIVKRNNRSGVVRGVQILRLRDPRSPEEKQRWFWVASWPLPDGRRKRVKYSVGLKYGEGGPLSLPSGEDQSARQTQRRLRPRRPAPLTGSAGPRARSDEHQTRRHPD